MSILQEYEEIRRWLGKEEYDNINRFLDAHPDVLLSDVYYKPETWQHYSLWAIKNEKDPKKKKGDKLNMESGLKK